MDDIKEIILYFENCDLVTIPRRYIGAFYLGKFERSIARRGCNYIGESEWANEFHIGIHVDADVEEQNDNFGNRYVFDRLTKYHDITAVGINYKTGKQKYYYVDYDEGTDEGKLGAENILQQTKLTKFGDLYITIEKDTQIDEVFPDEVINDKDSRDLQWDMYS